MAYTFALCSSGKVSRLLLAGFDGYEGGDPRNDEMNNIVKIFTAAKGSVELLAVTPTRYDVNKMSIYGLVK